MVVWDTRAPTYLGFEFPGQAGDRQEQMRAAAVDALFASGGAALDAGDRVSVFVHGVPDGPAARALRATDTDPAKLYETLRPTLGAPSSFTVAPSDGRLDASRRLSTLTLDLLEACDHCPDERSRGLRRDRQAGDYHPWLVTHHALAQAYVAHGFDKKCGEPDDVWLLWVTTGEGALGAGAIDTRLRDTFGEVARVWFRRLEAAYWREPAREDRLTKLFRVHRGGANPARVAQAPLTWREPDGHSAGITRTAQWRRGPIGLDALPELIWHVPVPSATLHHAAAWLDVGDGPVAVPLAWTDHELTLAQPIATRDALIAGLDKRATNPGVLSATLDARLWTLPPGIDLFGYPSVAILETTPVSSPPIRVAWVPINAWQIAIGVSVAGAIVVLIGAIVWTRTRVRTLRVAARWPDDAPVDLLALRDAPSFFRTAVLRLDDGTGLRPRNARLRVRVRLLSFLEPDVPLKHSDFQTLIAEPPWKPDGDGFVRELSRADGRWATQAPLTVVTRHPAIDFARVRSDQLGIVQMLRVTVHDASGRYLAAEETLFHEVRLVSVPGPAAPVVRFDLVSGYAARFVEAKVAGLPADAFAGARVLDLGWLSVANPIGGRWRPLAVRWTVSRAIAHATGDDGAVFPAEVRLRGPDGSDGAHGEVAADARAEVIVTVVLPDEARDVTRPRWRLTVTLDVQTDDGTPEGRRDETLARTVRVRTTGRPRLLVLDLGTSASRVLLQDLDEARWGFLPFHNDDDPADRPAAWGPDIAGEVRALAADIAARLLGPEVDVIRGSGRIAVHGGARGEIVALLPNEAPPAWRAAVEDALAAGPLGPADVLPIAEAEAAALWYASVAPERARVLFLDVGGAATDAALVDIDPSAARGTPVTTLATGAGRAGGASLLGAVVDALAIASGSPLRWASLDPADAWAVAPAVEACKRAMADGRPTDTLSLPIAGTELRATTAAARLTSAWTDALDRLVYAAVAPLLGRRPAPQTLADVDRVVLTGRGALAHGLPERAETVLAAWGLRVGRVTRVDRGELKAAGALGGRLYGLGLAGAFLPAAVRFADRLVLVTQIDGAPRAFELLAPGQAFLGGDLVGPWVSVPRWEDAMLFQTFRGSVAGIACAPWELDARRLRDLLVGEAADDGLPPAVAVVFTAPSFGHGEPGHPAARIRARISRALVVSVEEAPPAR